MRGMFFFITAIIALIYWDVKFKLVYLINRKAALRFLNKRFHGTAKNFFRILFWLTDFKIIVEKNELLEKIPHGSIFLVNHQSLIDIPVLIYVFSRFQIRFAAKESLFRFVPYISFVLRLQRHGRISRSGDLDSTRKQLENLARGIGRGECPLIFPEGTRSKTGRLRRFHTGGLRSILKVETAPIVVVAMDGGARVSDLHGIHRNIACAKYRIKVVDIIKLEERPENLGKLIDGARENISKVIDNWRNEN